MQFRKRRSRCMLISIGLLAVFAIITAALILAFVGTRAYPPTVRKQICITYRGVVNISFACNFLNKMTSYFKSCIGKSVLWKWIKDFSQGSFCRAKGWQHYCFYRVAVPSVDDWRVSIAPGFILSLNHKLVSLCSYVCQSFVNHYRGTWQCHSMR